MALNIQEGAKANVWKIVLHEKYADVTLSTGRNAAKKDEEAVWKNSSFFARFVGQAFEKIKRATKGDRIVILSGYVSAEPYEKDGEIVYPHATLTIFKFDFADASKNKTSAEKVKGKTNKVTKKNEEEEEELYD